MPVEHEHKYLLDDRVKLDVALAADQVIDTKIITQFYFGRDNDRSLTQRCRKVLTYSGAEYYITHKLGRGEKVQEVEYQVNADIYEEMHDFFKIGESIEKCRIVIKIDNLVWELDEFEGGLVMLELENPPERYKVPELFGKHRNVTGNFKYTNYYMAMNGYPGQ